MGRLVAFRLGEPDASGRRAPVATGETAQLPCSALIAAVGEQVDGAFFADNGIALDARGRAAVDGLLQTNVDGVYVIGDAHRGPATVVEAIADARTVADAIVGEHEYALPAGGAVSAADCLARQGVLRGYDCADREAERCLHCATVCECCAQVCPNRANVAITVKGLDKPQILHVDRLCNECGNCATFCPYDSRPYREKLTLFATREAFDESGNPGLLPLGGSRVLLRAEGVDGEIDLNDPPASLPRALEAVLRAVLGEYSYLIG